jgi:DNA-binding NarL/FixJ family response regulator
MSKRPTFSLSRHSAHPIIADSAGASADQQPATERSGPLGENDTIYAAVSIISNSQLLREGLASLLSTHAQLCIVGSYSGQLPIAVALPNPARHVVLLDGGLGRELAVAWTRRWRGLDSPPHIVVMELINDIDLIVSCVEAGAGGYTLQGASIVEVIETIDRVRRGVALCSPEVTARLFERLAALRAIHPPPMVAAPLTARELEVLHYIAQDYSNQAIAQILVIEVRTVKHHVHNILEKLSVRHRGDAARFAAEQGWLANAFGRE